LSATKFTISGAFHPPHLCYVEKPVCNCLEDFIFVELWPIYSLRRSTCSFVVQSSYLFRL